MSEEVNEVLIDILEVIVLQDPAPEVELDTAGTVLVLNEED